MDIVVSDLRVNDQVIMSKVLKNYIYIKKHNMLKVCINISNVLCGIIGIRNVGFHDMNVLVDDKVNGKNDILIDNVHYDNEMNEEND